MNKGEGTVKLCERLTLVTDCYYLEQRAVNKSCPSNMSCEKYAPLRLFCGFDLP